jgi:regulator of replication initiation timing
MMPDSKSIVDRLDTMENDIAQLQNDVKEIKLVIINMKMNNTNS